MTNEMQELKKEIEGLKFDIECCLSRAKNGQANKNVEESIRNSIDCLWDAVNELTA